MSCWAHGMLHAAFPLFTFRHSGVLVQFLNREVSLSFQCTAVSITRKIHDSLFYAINILYVRTPLLNFACHVVVFADMKRWEVTIDDYKLRKGWCYGGMTYLWAVNGGRFEMVVREKKMCMEDLPNSDSGSRLDKLTSYRNAKQSRAIHGVIV